MFCPKCNKHINDKCTSCNYCGASIEEYKTKLGSFSSRKSYESENIDNQKTNKSIINEEIEPIKTIKSNEEYLNAYLYDKRESIENQIISIPALLFGPFYYFYKKIWTYGFIILIFYIVIDLIPNTNISIIIKLLINIYLAIRFKKHCITYADNEVQKIERYNDDKTPTEIKKICKVKGKNIDLKFTMLAFVGYMIAVFILKANNVARDIPKEDTPSYKETPEEITEKSTTLLNISYNTHDVFKQTINEEALKYYVYANNEGGCYITMTYAPQEAYITALNYLSEITKLEEGYKKYPAQKVMVGIYQWDRMYLESQESRKDFFAIWYNNYIYEISFDSVSVNKDICEPYKREIMESVKFN